LDVLTRTLARKDTVWQSAPDAIIAMLRWFEHSQVYHPGRTMDADGSELGRSFEDAMFPSLDGVQLNGWFYPADKNSPRAQFAFLICHGNAGNISHRLDLYRALLETGAGVFAFDYRGYGRSHGRPDEEGTYLDAQAAHQWLRQKGYAGENLIVYGESLGGGIASELCLREETGGLVLQGTFTSVPDIGSELFPWLPVRWLGRIRYDTRSKLPQLRIPVLILHSRTDEIIGFQHAERNFATAKEPKQFQEIRGDHNNPLADRAGFLRGVEEFMRLVERAACEAGE
jgi:fermentation-respiration switch protein FrsA (DUF1100 family)